MSDTLEDRLIRRLRAVGFQDVEYRYYAGVPFLYLRVPEKAPSSLSSSIRRAALPLIRNTDLTFECCYVRSAGDRWVYRFRFRVPDEKSFCCGNHCPDCILLRPKRSR